MLNRRGDGGGRDDRALQTCFIAMRGGLIWGMTGCEGEGDFEYAARANVLQHVVGLTSNLAIFRPLLQTARHA